MNFDLLIALHKNNKRQGPGSIDATKQALQLSGLMEEPNKLKIADIGCGTGASTLCLAQELNTEITAVDLFADFLEILDKNANQKGLKQKIKTLCRSMEELPFEKQSLDAIWAEGSIYNIGFEKGIQVFKPFLKPNGILAVSEITWLTDKRPKVITDHWNSEYPEIDVASKKIKILEKAGFILKGYFPLPINCWIDEYYEPLENSFSTYLKNHPHLEAEEIVTAEKTEIELYKKYADYFSYGFYIAEKT